jgi:hypothetical protein
MEVILSSETLIQERTARHYVPEYGNIRYLNVGCLHPVACVRSTLFLHPIFGPLPHFLFLDSIHSP